MRSLLRPHFSNLSKFSFGYLGLCSSIHFIYITDTKHAKPILHAPPSNTLATQRQKTWQHTPQKGGETTSPPKLLLLKIPQPAITDKRERERELEAHIPAIPRQADFLADGPDEPDLRHAHDGAEDAEAKSQHGGAAGREEFARVVDGDVVLALLEDEVLG